MKIELKDNGFWITADRNPNEHPAVTRMKMQMMKEFNVALLDWWRRFKVGDS